MDTVFDAGRRWIRLGARVARSSIQAGLGHLGLEIRRRPTRGPYLGAAETVAAAERAGQSVTDYVEALWDQKGATNRVIAEMRGAGCLQPSERVCEIGPGTGRYLGPVLEAVHPEQYDIYEIAEDWGAWLIETYGASVTRQPADGVSLATTPDAACGLVHAHGLLVALRLLCSFAYLEEMIRICQPGGWIVFDYFPESAFAGAKLERWLESRERYPVVIPRATLDGFFAERGMTEIHSFTNVYGHSRSTYLVLRKR